MILYCLILFVTMDIVSYVTIFNGMIRYDKKMYSIIQFCIIQLQLQI